jgi:glycosyltransferase involved in cell wall biosynthesis
VSKISACLIVRNEAATLPRLLKQLRPHVDELVLLDTGSTDETPAIARKYADRFSVCLDFNNPETGLIEDFAGARNRAMEMCSGEWLFWCDGDDEIRGAEHLRALTERTHEDNVRIFLPYEYAHDDKGRCICLQWRERLMRPIQWLTWMSPVHEVCMPVAGAPGTFGDARNDQVRIIHRRGESKKPQEPHRNLRILKAYVAKVGEGDVRALYYLGVEAAHAGDMGTALRNLKRYIELSGWDDEKVMASLEIARLYRSIGDHETAIEWGTKAMLMKSWPEPYWELAKSFYALGWQNVRREYNYARAAHFIQLGLNMQNDTLLFENPMERHAIHELLNVCLLSTGNLEGAIASCEEGLQGMPENEALKTNLAKYVAEKRKRMVTGLLGEMVRAGDIDKRQEVLIRNTLTGAIQVQQILDEPREVEIKREERRADPGKLDIVFFVGHGLEPWNGQTIQETGMGGSETMEWELARRLARMGHRVRLFGHCTPTMEGLFDGVEFLDQGRYRNLDCDVLIASRRPDAVDDHYNVKAVVRLLHFHDVHAGEALTHERAYRFDGFLALSQWHKRCLLQVYPTLPEGKIIVTRNGLDLARFWMPEARNFRDPHRAVFSSSPDRGLQALLDMWPRIREQVPDAELRIFYSFNNWEAVARMNNDRAQLQQIANLKHLASTLPGVTLCGRVNQKQLAEEFMAAGVWLYPTWFHETYCITAAEAQAAGLRTVTSKLAGLTETVGEYGVLIPVDEANLPHCIGSDAYQKAFIEAAVAAMTRPDLGDRNGRIEAAKRFDMDELSMDWDRMLTEMHAKLSEDVIGPFQEVAQ